MYMLNCCSKSQKGHTQNLIPLYILAIVKYACDEFQGHAYILKPGFVHHLQRIPVCNLRSTFSESHKEFSFYSIQGKNTLHIFLDEFRRI